MRFRLFFVGLLGLLTACDKAPGPIRLDFVGFTNLTSSDRTVSAADSFRTHVYAQTSEADDPRLTRLKVTVTYSPEPEPFTYPVPLTSFQPHTGSTTLTMLDSTMNERDFFFKPTFGARSTSGTERWDYTVSNQDGHSTTRAYRLTVRKDDSAAVYHAYTVLPRLVKGPLARPYFALYPGLLLPRFAVENAKFTENQKRIDLVLKQAGTTFTLEAPASGSLTLPTSWQGTKRTTQLRRSTLDGTGFNSVAATADFANAFEGVPANTNPYSSGPLAAGNVIAFKTDDGKYGLIGIAAVALTPVPLLTCAVRMQK